MLRAASEEVMEMLQLIGHFRTLSNHWETLLLHVKMEKNTEVFTHTYTPTSWVESNSFEVSRRGVEVMFSASSHIGHGCGGK